MSVGLERALVLDYRGVRQVLQKGFRYFRLIDHCAFFAGAACGPWLCKTAKEWPEDPELLLELDAVWDEGCGSVDFNSCFISQCPF